MLTLPPADLVDQVVATLAWHVPLPQRADWLVMGAWLVQLRSRLLLPAAAPARQAAEGTVGQLRERLLGLAGIQALAGWLDTRPQLGRDTFARGVFARGAPEHPEALRPGEPALDVVAFLWAGVELFDAGLPQPDTTGPETAERYSSPPQHPATAGHEEERRATVTGSAPHVVSSNPNRNSFHAVTNPSTNDPDGQAGSASAKSSRRSIRSSRSSIRSRRPDCRAMSPCNSATCVSIDVRRCLTSVISSWSRVRLASIRRRMTSTRLSG